MCRLLGDCAYIKAGGLIALCRSSQDLQAGVESHRNRVNECEFFVKIIYKALL